MIPSYKPIPLQVHSLIFLLFLISAGAMELILRHDEKKRASKIHVPIPVPEIVDPRILALQTQDLMALGKAITAEKQEQPEYNREHVRHK